MSRAGKDTENILFCKDLEVLSAKARLQQTESPGPRREDAASQCDANGGKSILSGRGTCGVESPRTNAEKVSGLREKKGGRWRDVTSASGSAFSATLDAFGPGRKACLFPRPGSCTLLRVGS